MTTDEFLEFIAQKQEDLEAIDKSDPNHWQEYAWNTLQVLDATQQHLFQAVTLLRRVASGDLYPELFTEIREFVQ